MIIECPIAKLCIVLISTFWFPTLQFTRKSLKTNLKLFSQILKYWGEKVFLKLKYRKSISRDKMTVRNKRIFFDFDNILFSLKNDEIIDFQKIAEKLCRKRISVSEQKILNFFSYYFFCSWSFKFAGPEAIALFAKELIRLWYIDTYICKACFVIHQIQILVRPWFK